MAGWFCSPKSKEEETSLVSEQLRKQHNTTLNGVEKSSRSGSSDGKINVQCEKLLECEDVKDVTVSVEHMSANKLNFWLSKFSSFVKWPRKMESVMRPIRFMLFCAINCYLRETEGEDALNFLDKAHKIQVNCYLIVVIEMSNL